MVQPERTVSTVRKVLQVPTARMVRKESKVLLVTMELTEPKVLPETTAPMDRKVLQVTTAQMALKESKV